jgi:hypothetical protein
MASKKLVKKDEQGDDAALRERQIAALERLHELGGAPRQGDEQYSGNPQIRALQMVYEGRFGGPGLGQGRPRQRGEPRAAEVIAEEIRHRFTKRMTRAIERALRADAGVRANLDAVKLALEIENREAQLQLRESQADLETATKEELLVTLFELLGQPQTAAALDSTAIDITEAEVINGDEKREEGSSPVAGTNGSRGDSPGAAPTGSNGRNAGHDGRGRPKRDRSQSENPFTQAAVRRAAERRGASRLGQD